MIRFLVFLAVPIANLMASTYTACGPDEAHAKANLAQQISSEIQSNFKSNENVSKGFFTTNSKEVAYTISSSSSLTLSDVTYTKNAGEVCASIEKATLIQLAKGKIKAVKQITLENLPKDELKTINLLEGYLNDTNQAMAIASLHADAFDASDFSLLHATKQKLLDESSKHFAQKISFDIKPVDANLSIDGVAMNRHHNISLSPGTHLLRLSAPNYQEYTQEFMLEPKQVRTMTIDLAGNRYPQVYFALSQNARIDINNKTITPNSFEYVIPGKHTYKVSMEGYCPAVGDIELKLGETKTVKIENSVLTYPTLTVLSNQSAATLQINGEKFDLGKPKRFTQCEEMLVSYAVTFEGQTQTNTTTLLPGTQKEITVDFLTRSDREKLLAQATSFRNKGRYTLYAAQTYFESDAILQYGLERLNHKNWLRYGYGASYGGNSTDMMLNLYYAAHFQLTQFGSQRLPLHLGAYALIPYIGGHAGVAYQSMSTEETGFLLKMILGVSFVFNEDLSFELAVGHNFLYEEETLMTFGLSLRDPF